MGFYLRIYILCARVMAAGTRRAARPGRPAGCKISTFVDRASARATDAVESWGVSDATRF